MSKGIVSQYSKSIRAIFAYSFSFRKWSEIFFVIFGIQVFIFNYEYVCCIGDIRITSLEDETNQYFVYTSLQVFTKMTRRGFACNEIEYVFVAYCILFRISHYFFRFFKNALIVALLYSFIFKFLIVIILTAVQLITYYKFILPLNNNYSNQMSRTWVVVYQISAINRIYSGKLFSYFKVITIPKFVGQENPNFLERLFLIHWSKWIY